jgi:hypothetical protein
MPGSGLLAKRQKDVMLNKVFVIVFVSLAWYWAIHPGLPQPGGIFVLENRDLAPPSRYDRQLASTISSRASKVSWRTISPSATCG